MMILPQSALAANGTADMVGSMRLDIGAVMAVKAAAVGIMPDVAASGAACSEGGAAAGVAFSDPAICG